MMQVTIDYKGVNANEHAGFGKTVLTKNPTYSKRPQGYVRFVPKHFGSFDTEENHGDNIENTILVRNSQLQTNKFNKIANYCWWR